MAFFWTARFMAPTHRAHEFATIVRRTDSSVEATQSFFLPDQASVRHELIRDGLTPISIEQRRLHWWEKEIVSKEYRLSFLRAIAFHVKTGLSAGRSLELVIEGEENERLRVDLEPALEVLKRGGGFVPALRMLNFFDRATLAILEAGERTGALPSSIQSAVQYLESRNASWKLMIGAFSWMFIDFTTVISMLFAMQFQALPWLEKNGIESKDPQAVQAFNDALNTAYILNGTLLWSATLVTVFLTILIGVYVFIPAYRDKVDQMMTKVPFLGAAIEHGAMATTASIVSRMLRGFVRLTDAAEVAASATISVRVANLWHGARARMLNGLRPGQALNAEPLTKSERLTISAHQDATQLADVLQAVSERREEMATKSRRQLIVYTFYISLLYGAAGVLVALWVLWIQNQGMMATLGNIGN